MRALAIAFAVAAVLFLVTGGHFILIPLLFVPLGLFALRRTRQSLAAVRRRRRLNASEPCRCSRSKTFQRTGPLGYPTPARLPEQRQPHSGRAAIQAGATVSNT